MTSNLASVRAENKRIAPMERALLPCSAMIPQLKRDSARLFLCLWTLVVVMGGLSSLGLAQGNDPQTPSHEAAEAVQTPSTEIQTPSSEIQPPSGPTSTDGDEAQTTSIQLDGSVNWLARYALGDGRGLSLKNYSKGFTFSQSITLNTNIEVPVEQLDATLALLADLDTSQPGFLQSVQLSLTGRRWSVNYGDFPMGREGSPFAATGRTLTGVKGTWQASDVLSVQGTVAQVSGVKQTKTFRGNTAQETVQFAFHPPDRPLQSVPYLQSLDGLQYFSLGTDYVEGFTAIELAFRTDDSSVEAVLADYGLGFLTETIRDDPARELASGAFAVVFTGEAYMLVLKREYLALIRDRLLAYIDDYNTDEGLTGDEAESYPLTEGTQYERTFLDALSESVRIRADSQTFALDDAQRQRFYALGRTNVQEESISVEIRRDEDFIAIDEPELADFSSEIYGEPGILQLDAPSSFFEDGNHAMQVTFRYRAESQAYVLGLSVLPGSEAVFLNDERLTKGQDYFIQYEEGVLILQRQLGSEDVLRIEYETARGGLFGAGDYSRSFQGTSLQYTPSDDLTLNVDLFRAMDLLQGEVDPSTVATMPNEHWVAGVSGQWRDDGYTANFSLGTALNRFPPDDNQKENLPNRVNAIQALPVGEREFVLFGHRDGLTVYDGLNWSSYSATQGLLAGPTVYDIATTPGRVLIATSGGLSVVELDSGDPSAGFARRTNWTTIGALEGLPSSTTYTVSVQNNVVWIGTNRGLTTAPLGAMTDPQAWTVYRVGDGAGLPSNRIEHLASVEGTLYVGTDQGLVRFNGDDQTFDPIAGLSHTPIQALASAGNTLYVATDTGVRTLVDGRGVGWPVFGTSVQALDVQDGTLWYGTESGLFSGAGDRIEPARGRSVTAIGHVDGAVYAGERADGEFNLRLYRVRTPGGSVEVLSQSATGLNGRTENRYRPISASEHTETGWQGRASLSKDLGPLTLSSTLESVSPGFSPMGAFQNADQHRIRLGADYTVSEAVSFNAFHEEGILGLFAEPYQRIRDGLGVSIETGNGPTISLNSTLERIDRRFDTPGFDQRKTVYETSANQSIWNDRVTLRVAYSRTGTDDLEREVNSTVESRVSTGASVKGPYGINVNVGYQQPLTWRFDQVSGNRTLNWGANWSNSVSIGRLPLSLQANYSGSGRLPARYRGQTVTLDQNASLEAQGATLRLGSGTVTPNASISMNVNDLLSDNRRVQFNGQGTVRGNLGRFDSRLHYQRQQSFQAYSRLTRTSDSANASLSYLGFENLRPTLRVSGNRNTFAHPIFGQIANGNYEIATEAAWQPNGPWGANLTLSRRVTSAEREGTELVTYSFTQRLSYALIPELQPSVSFNAEYRQGTERNQPTDELRGEVNLEAQVTPIPDWSATVTGTYLFGVDAAQTDRDYNSFAISVDFGRQFSF